MPRGQGATVKQYKLVTRETLFTSQCWLFSAQPGTPSFLPNAGMAKVCGVCRERNVMKLPALRVRLRSGPSQPRLLWGEPGGHQAWLSEMGRRAEGLDSRVNRYNQVQSLPSWKVMGRGCGMPTRWGKGRGPPLRACPAPRPACPLSGAGQEPPLTCWRVAPPAPKLLAPLHTMGHGISLLLHGYPCLLQLRPRRVRL